MSVSRIAVHSIVISAQYFVKVAGRVVYNGSEIVRNRSVESAALTELGREHADAAAVTQLVNCVENVDDVEANFDGSLVRYLDPARQAEVIGFIGMILHGVGEAAAQTIAVEAVDGHSPIIPNVGSAGRTGEALVMIKKDKVVVDVSDLIWTEEKLGGAE